jgi:hypothetical protein
MVCCDNRVISGSQNQKTMHISSQDVIIKGLTTAGKAFRPSDWAERLSSVLSSFGADNRMSYSPYVRPMTLEGVKCVVVDKKLEQVESQAYRFLMGFAQDNDLQLENGDVWANAHPETAAANEVTATATGGLGIISPAL